MPKAMGRVAATVNALANHNLAEADDHEFDGAPADGAGDSDSDDHATWSTLQEALEEEGLGQYWDTMEEHGYDSLAVLKKAKRIDIDEMIAKIGMKLGDALTLRVRILNRTVRGDITRRRKPGSAREKQWAEPELPARVAHMAKCWFYSSLLLILMGLILGLACNVNLKGEDKTTQKVIKYNDTSDGYDLVEPAMRAGYNIDYVQSCLWHVAIVMAMLIPLGLVRLWNKSVQEVTSLFVYIILALVVIFNMFKFASTSQEANDFMRQVQEVTDDEFHADGSPIVMHWIDIAEAGHWYTWMRSVVPVSFSSPSSSRRADWSRAIVRCRLSV